MQNLNCLLRWALGITAVVSLSGCIQIGPTVLRAGRMKYNEALQNTAKEQTLLNILRTAANEPPMFVDISEIDATIAAEATADLGSTQIGRNAEGSVGIGGEWEENPTIRYIPLQGQAYVAQIASPITVDSISNLYESDWPIGPLLTLSAQRLAPNFLDNEEVGILFVLLDRAHVIEISADRSEFDPSYTPKDGSSYDPSKVPPNNTLTVFFQPDLQTPFSCKSKNSKAAHDVFSAWTTLLSIYDGTQPSQAPLQGLQQRVDHACDIRSFQRIYSSIPNKIELRTQSVEAGQAKLFGYHSSLSPFLRLRSGLAMLTSAVNGNNGSAKLIETVDRVKFLNITNRVNMPNDGFYHLLYGEESLDQQNKEGGEIGGLLDCETIHTSNFCSAEFDRVRNVSDSSSFPLEVASLGYQRRRLILIIKSKSPPPGDAYVSYPFKGAYYYIDGVDKLSQRNFELLSELLTMQALSPAAAPTTLSIGGK